ncbi:MAG: hypothetical protein WC505_04750 [Patescibacteria group bacterium]
MKRFLLTIKKARKCAILCVGIAIAVSCAAGGRVATAEWIEPDDAPPEGTFYAPITQGSENQAKKGYVKLDPRYTPTDDYSLTYRINKPLEVAGIGAKFSTPDVFANLLYVDTDTLYADSFSNWTGINTDVQLHGVQLEVADGTVTATHDNGPAVRGYSGTGAGIYGSGGAAGIAGVYGLRASNDGWAVYGESEGNVGVRGESEAGAGIYATTNSDTMAAVYARNDNTGWAAYFDGKLGAGSDVITNQFYPTTTRQSLLPYTSGQKVAEYTYGADWSDPVNAILAFDGTYVWAATKGRDENTNNLFKIRAADGQTMDAWRLDSIYSAEAMAFDGRYLWLYGHWNRLARFDTVTNAVLYSELVPMGAQDVISVLVTYSGGEEYIWVPDWGNNQIFRFNASTFSTVAPEAFLFTDTAVIPAGSLPFSEPAGSTYDGEYIWIAGYATGTVARIWAENPKDSGHPGMVIDTTTSAYNCAVRKVVFDGEYVWCLQGNTLSYLVRIWAEDPYDPRHPIRQFGPLMGGAKGAVFDGTYLWVVNHLPGTNGLYRFLAADPAQYERVDSTIRSEYLVFDGTFIWVIDETTGTLEKFYSGAGTGAVYQNNMVALQTYSGQCNADSSYRCMTDADCVQVGGTCNVQMYAQQGEVHISGSAEFNDAHCFDSWQNRHYYDRACTADAECGGAGWYCIGGDVTAGADVDADGNVWGGSDDARAVPSGGSAECSDGQFIKGITLDGDSEITAIICRQL